MQIHLRHPAHAFAATLRKQRLGCLLFWKGAEMKRTILSLLGCWMVLASAYAGDVTRTFKNENVGNVSLVAPSDWKPIERHHIKFGTTFYRLQPAVAGQFDFEILVNDLVHMDMQALVDKDLERYIQSNMAPALSQSTEGKVSAIRFGTKRDGVYARLTDKAPKPGEFILFTQGVRLQGKKVVLFTLYSNDKEGAVLRKALNVVDSVKFEQ